MTTSGRAYVLLRWVVVFAVATLTACPNEDPDADRERNNGSSAGVSELEVTIDDGAASVPPLVSSGPVDVSFENSVSAPVGVVFGRVNEDAEDDEVTAALDQGPEAVIEVASVAGGLPPTDPGKKATATISFPPGRYFAAAFESGDNFEPAFFEVEEGDADGRKEPEAHYSIQADEFLFNVTGDVPAFEATVLIENLGAQSHEVVITKGKGSKEETVAELLAPAPNLGKLWTTLTLEPGTYKLACYIPDPRNGKPHAKLGMVKRITVGAAL